MKVPEFKIEDEMVCVPIMGRVYPLLTDQGVLTGKWSYFLVPDPEQQDSFTYHPRKAWDSWQEARTAMENCVKETAEKNGGIFTDSPIAMASTGPGIA